MAQDLYKALTKLLADGVSIEQACRIIVTESENLSPTRMYFMHQNMNIDELPDPKCLAGKLRGKDHPTRQDFVEAYKACLASSN